MGIAFIGAEGHGRNADAWRNASMVPLFVDNFSESGSGSLRAAIIDSRPRIILFDVGGLWTVGSTLTFDQPNAYLAGQTAPGKGVCLTGGDGESWMMGVQASHVCLRFFRIRPGATGAERCLAINRNHGVPSIDHVIADHLSMSWNGPNSQNIVGIGQASPGSGYTLQWSIVSEAFGVNFGSQAVFFTIGPTSWGSCIKTLMARCGQRQPMASAFELCDIRNNIIYNYGGSGSRLRTLEVDHPSAATQDVHGNIVNNYYKSGPTTIDNGLGKNVEHASIEIVGQCTATPTSGGFISGNLRELFTGSVGTAPVDESTCEPQQGTGPFPIVGTPYATDVVHTLAAANLATALFPTIGCSKPQRDATDARLITEYNTRTEAFHGHLSNPSQVGGFDNYATGEAPQHERPSGMRPSFRSSVLSEYGINLANSLADARSTSISVARGVEDEAGMSNLEYDINHRASDPYSPPLFGGGGPDVIPPAAPTGLTVLQYMAMISLGSAIGCLRCQFELDRKRHYAWLRKRRRVTVDRIPWQEKT